MPADTRVEDFEAATRTVSEPIFNKPLAEISFGIFMIRLFRVAQRYNYQVQPQLVLLQKTVLNVEGLGRDLYPQLDLWATAVPVLEAWMKRRANPKIAAKRLGEQLPQIVDSLPELTASLMRRLEYGNGPATDRLQHSLEHVAGELRRARRGQRWVVAGAALIVVAVLLPLYPGSQPWQAWALAALGLAGWWRAWRM